MHYLCIMLCSKCPILYIHFISNFVLLSASILDTVHFLEIRQHRYKEKDGRAIYLFTGYHLLKHTSNVGSKTIIQKKNLIRPSNFQHQCLTYYIPSCVTKTQWEVFCRVALTTVKLNLKKECFKRENCLPWFCVKDARQTKSFLFIQALSTF